MQRVNVDKLPWLAVSHNAAIKKRVFLQSGEVPGVTQFAQAVLRPGDISNEHSHADMHEVFYFASGSGRMVNDPSSAV